MLSKLWFRFGIPLGSATVLAALLDLALALYWFLNDVGGVLYFHYLDHAEPTDYRTYLGLTSISLKIFLTLCLWIFILLGQRGLLLFWIPLSIIGDFLFIGLGINNCTHFTFISDEIWFLNLAVVVLLRFYITCVIYQAFHRLLQNARVETLIIQHRQQISAQNSAQNSHNPLQNGTSGGHDDSKAPLTLGSEDISVLTPSTPLPPPAPLHHYGNLRRKGQVEMPTGQESPRFLLMEPIGESPGKIWQFYNDTPRLGAAVLVTFELIWNIFALSTHSMTEFMLGGRIFFMPQEEEIFMRIWRIVVDTAAIIFIFKRRKTLLRFWLIMYFWTLFASLCIFMYVMAEWFDPPSIVVVVIVCTFLGDNLIRFGVLYFTLRVTTLPPPSPSSTDVVRSHSLRSQCRPRTKKSRAKKKFDEIHGIQPPAPMQNIQDC